jgi:hypothetical protein
VNAADIVYSTWGGDVAAALHAQELRALRHRLQMLDQQRQRLVLQIADLSEPADGLVVRSHEVDGAVGVRSFGGEVVGEGRAQAVHLFDSCKRFVQFIHGRSVSRGVRGGDRLSAGTATNRIRLWRWTP